MRSNSLMQTLREGSMPQVLFWGLGAVTLLSIWAGVALNFIYLAGLPLLLLAMYWTVIDMRIIYFLMLALRSLFLNSKIFQWAALANLSKVLSGLTATACPTLANM